MHTNDGVVCNLWDGFVNVFPCVYLLRPWRHMNLAQSDSLFNCLYIIVKILITKPLLNKIFMIRPYIYIVCLYI